MTLFAQHRSGYGRHWYKKEVAVVVVGLVLVGLVAFSLCLCKPTDKFYDRNRCVYVPLIRP